MLDLTSVSPLWSIKLPADCPPWSAFPSLSYFLLQSMWCPLYPAALLACSLLLLPVLKDRCFLIRPCDVHVIWFSTTWATVYGLYNVESTCNFYNRYNLCVTWPLFDQPWACQEKKVSFPDPEHIPGLHSVVSEGTIERASEEVRERVAEDGEGAYKVTDQPQQHSKSMPVIMIAIIITI